MNLGLGTNTSTFNISLNDMPFNETGNGTLCLPHLDIPTDLDLPIEDGTNATLQVVTVGEGGTALYSVGLEYSVNEYPSHRNQTDIQKERDH